jgi:tetratricopeptide (TPR) repeat protein
MRSIKILLPVLIFLGFTFMGYQCGSTELTSAKLYIQQNNYDKALESLLREVEKNPKSDEGYYLLGVVYGEKQQYEDMIKAFEQSLAISQNYKEYINDSQQYYWANAFNAGVKAYQEGVNSQNEDSSKVFLDKAAHLFELAIRLEPDSVDSYRNLAFVHMNTGDYDKAIEPLEKIIEKEKSVDSYKYLGEILYEQGMKHKATDSVTAMQYFEKGIKILEEGSNLFPNDSDILLTLSNTYIAANKIDIAEKTFKAGVEAEPNNQYYRYNYGVVLLGSNRFEEAEQQFLKAVEIDPNYQNALYNLGVTYVRWGSHLNEQAEAAGEMESGYKEKYQKALPYLEKVVELKNDDATTWELLGKVYGVLGMQDDAANAFNKADELRMK